MKMFQGCLLFFATIGRFFDMEEAIHTYKQLTAEERSCCGSFFSEEPLPRTCLEETRCPFFSPPHGEGGDKEVQGLAFLVWVTLISASLFAALAALHGTLFRVVRQCVFHSLGELLIVWLVNVLCGSHIDGSSWVAYHVYLTFSCKVGVSSFILLVGSSGVTKLDPNLVYVLIESLYANMVAPVVLVCLGIMSMKDALVCIQTMSIPIAILVGIRARGVQYKVEYIDDLIFGANVGKAGGIGSPWVSISEKIRSLKEWVPRKLQQRLDTSAEQTS